MLLRVEKATSANTAKKKKPKNPGPDLVTTTPPGEP
jgi:hypothetical protein